MDLVFIMLGGILLLATLGLVAGCAALEHRK
jgi:hypothetical protein